MKSDLFDQKNIQPMLLDETAEPFDSEEYIFELKLDGIRCLAYLDKGSTVLYNRHKVEITAIYPELHQLHQHVKKKCILDGELIVVEDGKPSFFLVDRRAHMRDPVKIRMDMRRTEVVFVAYDILYCGNKRLDALPLIQRKKILADTVRECPQLSCSRYIDGKGIDLYRQAEAFELEGIVAKRKDSLYQFQRSPDWIKIKNYQYEDCAICGYIPDDGKNTVSLILGRKKDKQYIYAGRVTLAVSSKYYRDLLSLPRQRSAPFEEWDDRKDAIWVKPLLSGKVQFMEYNRKGGFRQPVLRDVFHA